MVLWETEEAADTAAIDRGVMAAHVKLFALGLTIEARKIYDVVVHDQPRREPTGMQAELSPTP